MEIDRLRNLEEEPPLSGAYLRSLVKQLTTSRSKDLMNQKDQNCANQAQQQSTQPPQHKKQVRRRLHTSKPYQERLLNMAEARKEIVTALKFHRAAMKEANEQQQQQQQQQQQTQEQQLQRPSVSPQDGRYKSRRNPRIYPSCTNNSSIFMDDFSYPYSSHLPPVPNSYTWPAASPIAPPPPLMAENPNFILPNQTLGLNLNFNDFSNLDATVHLNNNQSSSSSSSSYSSGTSYSPPPQEVPLVGQVEGFSFLVDSVESNAATQVTGGLHTAMDDEAMEEIRSLGDQYQMEWNDTMNLVKSACWFKFLKNMEHKAPEANGEDQLLEFPTWLNENDLEQCSEDYFQDSSTLPCMDIGDIDGMDDDWLA